VLVCHRFRSKFTEFQYRRGGVGLEIQVPICLELRI